MTGGGWVGLKMPILFSQDQDGPEASVSDELLVRVSLGAGARGPGPVLGPGFMSLLICSGQLNLSEAALLSCEMEST